MFDNVNFSMHLPILTTFSAGSCECDNEPLGKFERQIERIIINVLRRTLLYGVKKLHRSTLPTTSLFTTVVYPSPNRVYCSEYILGQQ
jgi:hypothetical protein